MERLAVIFKPYYHKIISGLFCAVMLSLSLGGCSSLHRQVPVKDAWGPIPASHQVKRDETLYAIAWRYGRDYRELARLNKIAPPYKIKVGQKIKLPHVATAVVASKNNKLAPKASHVQNNIKSRTSFFSTLKPTEKEFSSKLASAPAFIWPVDGRIVASFAARGGMNKGIDIAAKPDAVVKATAAGRVVYSGSGLRGYGELIIIKHNDVFLSAYAHNKKLFVREGEEVTAGKVIAQVGDSDAKRVLLHFEIRQAGKPVDPLKYLPSIKSKEP